MIIKLWHKLPKGLRDILIAFYCISAFIVFPWFLGAIFFRQEQYLWIGDEWAHHPDTNIGVSNKLVGIYTYLVFYLAWFLIAYFIYRLGKDGTQARIRSLEDDVKRLSGHEEPKRIFHNWQDAQEQKDKEVNNFSGMVAMIWMASGILYVLYLILFN
ncbi:MAG: hypothetical protein A3B17_00275 [Candidatus Yanofskybacteria bacterium RIFCSPLOWO2_01_FULL_45_72]|nr:MAG: hypothetical protein A3B17_00275 [Candidatus Yanofskybacteria bacterium RIFCSPLOWO2_01_FULL_45_72]